MGGNLFKLGRLPKLEYKVIEDSISEYLTNKIGENNFKIPRYYNDKKDFGDLDVLINLDAVKDWKTFKLELIKDLEIETSKSSGHIFSTVYKNFQVDFFNKPAKYYESSYYFLSFNDVGNIIGRMFRRMGLKYGEKGIIYVYRRENDGHYAKEIPISVNFEKIIEFIGLNFSEWEKGFNALDDVFRWVIKSPYFSTKPYLEPNKAINKRKQRTTIIAFIEFLKTNNIEINIDYKGQTTFIDKIHDYFPEADLHSKIELEKEREAFVNIIKAKYNGRVIMELFPDLLGKDLGNFMNAFQNSLGHYEQVFYDSSKNEIIEMLKEFKQNYDTSRT